MGIAEALERRGSVGWSECQMLERETGRSRRRSSSGLCIMEHSVFGSLRP